MLIVLSGSFLPPFGFMVVGYIFLAISAIWFIITLFKILLRVFFKVIGWQFLRIKQSALLSLYKITIVIALLSYGWQPIVKYTLVISVSQGAISDLQVFRALFRILFSPSTILFKRRLIVLAISLIIMSLSTLRRVAGVLPIISLRSARAGQGKNLSVRIFAFLSLLLIASDSPVLCMGGRYRSFTRRPAFFFTHFTII